MKRTSHDLKVTDDKHENNQTQTEGKDSESITQVDFRLDEPRGSCSFKGNRKLWKAFVKHCKAEYGSVCHVLEPIQVAFLTSKVNLSSTLKPLVIENLTVERAVKRVRRYGVEVEEVCGFRGCRRESVARGIWLKNGEEFALCGLHLLEAELKSDKWRVLDE